MLPLTTPGILIPRSSRLPDQRLCKLWPIPARSESAAWAPIQAACMDATRTHLPALLLLAADATDVSLIRVRSALRVGRSRTAKTRSSPADWLRFSAERQRLHRLITKWY